MDFDVLVLGGANYDYLIKGPALPSPGETLAGETFDEAPGGKGANQAVAAARLGARVAFVSRVGDDDRGARVRQQLADEHVDVAQCLAVAMQPTGVALVLVGAEGQKLIMTAPGANRVLDEAAVDATFAKLRARVVVLQLEVSLATTLAAAHRARDLGARVVLDAAPPQPLPDPLVATLDVLRCNAAEARVITGIEVSDVASARAAAATLLDRGAGAACIGADGGDLLVWREGEQWLPHQRVTVVDATGAGDAFVAGIAVGLAEERPLADAGWLGCAASALATTRVGAQAGLPARADVDRLLASVRRVP